jgi:myo-inositol catabolism protein IolC
MTPLGYDRPLYLLAFDHRGSFQKGLFGVEGTPSPEIQALVSDTKQVIYEAFEAAIARGASRETSGILVDEQLGADIARRAKAGSFVLAMPVEKSGQDEFDFEFGEDFGRHVEAFDPTFAKVLVRYNPEGDREINRRQAERLARLGVWLHERDRRYLFELLVPATAKQLARVGGDAHRYDTEIRPSLVVRTIGELQAAGVEPDVWKIEGLDARGDCERVAEQARAGGRDGVVCIVLGRGADEAGVRRWLEAGAGVLGYAGFAIGRTLWWNELTGYIGGSLTREAAAERIAGNYLRMIDAYAATTVT